MIKTKTAFEVWDDVPENDKENLSNQRWAKVEDLKKWLNNNSSGFRELGYNSINSDELIKILDNLEQEGNYDTNN